MTLWSAAATTAAAVLAVAIAGRDHGLGPTLRPMIVSASMTDGQARQAADTTVRAWVRERNAHHLANLEALTCPDPPGLVGRELTDLRNHQSDGPPMEIVATGALTRHNTAWGLNTHLTHQSMVFVMQIDNTELKVCAIGSAKIP